MARQRALIEKVVEVPSEVLDGALMKSKQFEKIVSDQPVVKQVGKYWQTLGPGLTTGASDDDPSGIATYSQTGAQYGLQLLWLALFTFPLMAVVQEMCARIGLITGRGLAANIRHNFPKSVLYTATALLFIANTLNIGADLGAVAEAVRLLQPRLGFGLLVIFFALLTIVLQIFSSYERYAQYLKWLAILLSAYILSAFFIRDLDWAAVARATFIPSLHLGKDQIILICAILGTTISPYLFFWQTSQEVEQEISEGKTSLRARQVKTSFKAIKRMRIDIWSGMFFSNLAMFFIIVATAGTLFKNGITNIATAADAARALEPLAGPAAALLFAVGILAVGLLGIPVLAGSSSYAIAESFGWQEGLSKKLRQAQAFYGVIIISMFIGLGLNFIGLDPIKALIYSAIANGLVAPVALALIVLLSSNKKVMGEQANHPVTTLFGWFIVAIMALAGLATIYSLFFAK